MLHFHPTQADTPDLARFRDPLRSYKLESQLYALVCMLRLWGKDLDRSPEHIDRIVGPAEALLAREPVPQPDLSDDPVIWPVMEASHA